MDMEEKLKKVLCELKYSPAVNLAPNIWQTILLREKRATNLKLFAYSFAGFASLLGLVPALKILGNDLTQSGFYQYFSLIFSDSGLIFSSWKEFAFSLAQSLPTMSIVLSLSLVLIFFLSIKYAVKQIIKNRMPFTKSVTLSF